MIDPNDQILNLNSATSDLALFMSSCEVLSDGTVVETRKRVAEIGEISIHIYSNEHPPPHFHIRCNGKDASFAIKDCSKINGSLGKKEKVIKYWFDRIGKRVLIKEWDKLRPGDCVVGKYMEF